MNRKGYSLIELTVGIALFLLIIVPAFSFFVSSLNTQQRVLFTQKLLDNTSYALEYMSRTLRMAKKDTDGVCITQNWNYELTRSGKGIKFLSYDGVCQEFYVDTGTPRRLVEAKGTVSPVPIFLSAADADVIFFGATTTNSDWGPTTGQQPKVTLFLEIKAIKSNKPKLQPHIKIQTTISQRNLNL